MRLDLGGFGPGARVTLLWNDTNFYHGTRTGI